MQITKAFMEQLKRYKKMSTGETVFRLTPDGGAEGMRIDRWDTPLEKRRPCVWERVEVE